MWEVGVNRFRQKGKGVKYLYTALVVTPNMGATLEERKGGSPAHVTGRTDVPRPGTAVEKTSPPAQRDSLTKVARAVIGET